MTPDKMPDGELVLGMVPLGLRRGAYRYAVYLLAPEIDRNGPLWGPYTPPETSDKARKALAPKTWPGMVYWPLRPSSGGGDDLPAWHFALNFSPTGWGSDSGVQGFAHAMARHLGRPITLRMLHGWASTAFRGEPAQAEG